MPKAPAQVNSYLWIQRLRAGFSRKRVASFMGNATTSQLCRWETGAKVPSLANALVLAHLFGTPVEELFRDLREQALRDVRKRQMGDAG